MYVLLEHNTYSDVPRVLLTDEDYMFLHHKACEYDESSDNFEWYEVKPYEDYLEDNLDHFNAEESEYSEYKMVDEYGLYHLLDLPSKEKMR